MAMLFSGAEPLGRLLAKKLAGHFGWFSRHYYPGRLHTADDGVPAEISAVERAVALELARGRRRRKRRTQPAFRRLTTE
ncbi:MAG: hypothetical protein Kow0031_20810 [Anaerolineae bacterium]